MAINKKQLTICLALLALLSGCTDRVGLAEQQMQDIHEALTIAIVDIVQRWWTDTDARFPERMPLEKKEEDILKVRFT